jgi:hypothetical protein
MNDDRKTVSQIMREYRSFFMSIHNLGMYSEAFNKQPANAYWYKEGEDSACIGLGGHVLKISEKKPPVREFDLPAIRPAPFVYKGIYGKKIIHFIYQVEADMNVSDKDMKKFENRLKNNGYKIVDGFRGNDNQLLNQVGYYNGEVWLVDSFAVKTDYLKKALLFFRKTFMKN